MRSLEDWELVALAKQGNISAFETLITRYKDKLLTFSYFLTRDLTSAEDIVQESFIRVYKSLRYLKPSAQFKTFIFGIARNLALNYIRDEKRRKNFLARVFEYLSRNYSTYTNSSEDPSASLIRREIEDVIEQTLLELSPEHREILVLRETLGLDYESISKILNCNIGTVKSRLARAREHLRKKLISKGVELK